MDARLGSFALLSLPLCMLAPALRGQTILPVTDMASLRAAISSANTGTGDYVINLAAGTYQLTGAAGENANAQGDLDITKASGSVIISGAGAIVDGGQVDRLFHINSAGVSVTFQGLTLRNGKAVDNGTAGSEARGGAVYVQNAAQVILDNVNIENNEAAGANGATGAGIYGQTGGVGASARGGALYIAAGTVSISECTFTQNAAQGGKGGLGGPGQDQAYTLPGTASNSIVNGAPGGKGGPGGKGQGGAIYLAAGTLNLGASTCVSNAALGGEGGEGHIGADGSIHITSQTGFGIGMGGPGGNGGIGGDGQGGVLCVAGGTANLVNATLSGNSCAAGNGGNGGRGGGGYATGLGTKFAVAGSGGNGANSGISQGGGEHAASGALGISNSTMTLNIANQGAAGTGGAIGTQGGAYFTAVPGTPGVAQSTQGGGIYVGAATVVINSSIFSENSAIGGSSHDAQGDFTAGASLFKVAPAGTLTPGSGANVLNVDAALGSLANNGGPTMTHALSAASPAVNTGSNPLSLTEDQRGFARVSGLGADMGAFERQVPGAPAITAPTGPTWVNTASFDIQGSAVGGTLVRIYRDSNNNSVVDQGESVVVSQQLGTGVSAFSLATPLIANAANNFLVTCDDGSIESAATDVPTITQDSVAPAQPVVTDPASPVSLIGASYTLIGTAEAGALLRVYRDVNQNGSLDAGEPMVASQQLAGTAFNVAAPLAASSANYFIITATDAASNESAPRVLPAITETTIPPTPPPTITSPATALTVNQPSFNIRGTATAGALVRIYSDANGNGQVDGADAVVAQQSLSGSAFDLPVTLAQNSANHFTVTAALAGFAESTPVQAPTITDDAGFSGGAAGGGAGGCAASSSVNWPAVLALLLWPIWLWRRRLANG